MSVRKAGKMHISRLFNFILENIGRSGIIEGITEGIL